LASRPEVEVPSLELLDSRFEAPFQPWSCSMTTLTWWRRFSARSSSPISTHSRRLCLRLEALEDRTLLSTNLLFDPSSGQLAIRSDVPHDTVRETISPAGFVEIDLDGQRHSADPASPFFDNSLAGATANTFAGLRLEEGSSRTLIVGPQHLAGGLTVWAPGAAVETLDVALSESLTVQAQTVTVDGVLSGRAIRLLAPGLIVIEAGGVLEAGQGDTGGRIEVSTDVFVNSGLIHADGRIGGVVVAQARNILNAASITADSSGPGAGGAVSIRFTDSYIDTVAARTSANSTGGPGGSVTIDGGTTGRLFSSGSQQAVGSTGGQIGLLGGEVLLVGARVDASGTSGGGSVRVGGDRQVVGPRLNQTTMVSVTPATTIRADALGAGSGGRVVVWSDRNSVFSGLASTRGGSAGGAGGFIEVSGQGNLNYAGRGDAGASAGPAGTLLLDPKNLIISETPVGVFPQFDLLDPHPTRNGAFGSAVTVLRSGNVVVTNPADDFGGSSAGAVYLFNGRTGTLISSLVGSSAGDQVGSAPPTLLSNGNYLLRSSSWNGSRGALTWGSGTAGVSGAVSASNSLVGSASGDYVGDYPPAVSSNGNYLARTPLWNGGFGAVTWGNGATGVRGVVSAANSLVGSSTTDHISENDTVTALSTGSFIVATPGWNGRRGAVTWVSGTAGGSGTISATNSLVGTDPGDMVGGGIGGGITLLSNGSYVVTSRAWNGGRGAITWGSGTAGVRGAVSETNSLVGSNPSDLSSGGVVALNNGNYVVVSDFWNNQLGAVTWGSGTAGVHGVISETNSLVGSHPNDLVGRQGIFPLANGNYLIGSPLWNGNRGAVTWGSGTAGVSGVLDASNSLVGSSSGDQVSYAGVAVLSNGNYVLRTPNWSNQRGAATWGSGTAGVQGVIDATNSLVGAQAGDRVGTDGITALSNGNYTVVSTPWNSGRGAVTWGNGATGTTGVVDGSNSLVGSTTSDGVGSGGVTALSNGNYVVNSPGWNATLGAVTWGDGTTGITGVVSADNSLVGAAMGDQVGSNGVTGLTNGSYVVRSPAWNGQRGAATWGSGTAGVQGVVSETNSLVGSNSNDQVGGRFGSIHASSNGNYVIRSLDWNGRRGAVSWGSGTSGVSGVVSEANSLVGSNPNDLVGSSGITVLNNGNYLVNSGSWGGGLGAVTWGDGSVGVSGFVSSANSLVGTVTSDVVGYPDVIVLSNGNYVVRSLQWNGGRGAVTWGSGTAGVSGVVSAANSVIGATPGDLANSEIIPLSTGDLVIRSPGWSNGTAQGAGAATWVSGTSGQTQDGSGVISTQNSLVGRAARAGLRSIVEDPVHGDFLATFLTEGGGRVTAGVNDPNQFTFAQAPTQTVTLTPEFLTRTLNSGTAVVLQANNDITVEDPILVNAGGNGGALTLQAGRSILLNASIVTDGGDLSLIANDTLADGVVDSQRDVGNAFITMAGGTILDAGTGAVSVALRDGAGRTNTTSRAINLQAISAGSVNVLNNGPSAGSDIRLGSVTSSGPQSYSTSHGSTTVAGNLTAADQPITFTDSVQVEDGLSIDAGASAVTFAGAGTQMLRAGPSTQFGNLVHTGTGTLLLSGPLTVNGVLTNAAGTFDTNDQAVTVTRLAQLTGGTWLAGTALQDFQGGLVVAAGLFTSSTGPMTVDGAVVVLGGVLGGQGAIGPVTLLGGTLQPGDSNPGVLQVAGALTLFATTTFSVRLNGLGAGSDYSQVAVSGPVTLSGSTLQLTLGFEPPPDSSFEILTTTDPAGVRGTFDGLDEGALFEQDGHQFQITYHGGAAGTSVVLTRVA
jgi:hypothetical protein